MNQCNKINILFSINTSNKLGNLDKITVINISVSLKNQKSFLIIKNQDFRNNLQKVVLEIEINKKKSLKTKKFKILSIARI